jgi:hypothetical protein
LNSTWTLITMVNQMTKVGRLGHEQVMWLTD